MPYREDTLPLQNYDRQKGWAIAAKLTVLSQRELQVVYAYETERENRAEVLQRIAELSMAEPWEGYDDQDGATIAEAVSSVDAATARRVLSYEREHRARAQVIRAAGAVKQQRPAV